MAQDIRALIAACKRAVKENQLTSGGLPKVDFLESVVGGEVTAAERDEAWAAVQEAALEDQKDQAETVPSGPLVYVGPTLRKPLVGRNTVFATLPQDVAALRAADRNFRLLIVDPTRLAKVKAALADSNSRLARVYRAVAGQYGKRGD